MELFQGDEHTFECGDHSVPFLSITRVEWSVASDICARIDMRDGVITRTLYCDLLRGRALMTPDNLTISSLQATEEAIIQCQVEKDWLFHFIQGQFYNLTIKGE